MTPNTNPAEILRALALIRQPGDVAELRIPEAVSRDSSYPRTMSGYFTDWNKLASAAAAIRSAPGFYITLNPVDPALLARACERVRALGKKDPTTSDDNIVRRCWLPVDSDPVRPSGISSTDAEHEAALARSRAIRDALWGEGWPDPILADSGNGGHLLYPIDLPADDGRIVEKVLAALAARFSDDVVKVDVVNHNQSRIWKLYGTLAAKGDNTPDRPHRMARIIDAPDKLEGGAL